MAKSSLPLTVIRSTEDVVRIPQMFPNHHRILFPGRNVDKPFIPKIARLAQQHKITDIDAADLNAVTSNRRQSPWARTGNDVHA